MENTRRIFRDRESLKRYYTLFVLFWGILGIALLFMRAILDPSPIPSLLVTLFYYTVQSNILLTVVTFLFYKQRNHSQFFVILSYIAAVNIFITSAIFHTLLLPYMNSVSFLNHITHTINPILYLGLFFVYFNEKIALKKFWTGLIYPLCYLGFVYLFVEPLFGNMLDQLMPNFVGARYVYPFLDPRTYPNGVTDLLIFNLLILAPLIAMTAFLLLFLKQKFQKRVILKQKNTP